MPTAHVGRWGRSASSTDGVLDEEGTGGILILVPSDQ